MLNSGFLLPFIISLIIEIAAFITAITIHEFAHAFAADKLGDPTARLMGRLSLNPLVHYDPLGTSLLLILVIMRAFGIPVIPFGWAKPVQFDPYNLQNPKRDAAIISFAGPLSNIALATFLGIIYRVILASFGGGSPIIELIFESFITLNVVLAVFNLIPVHPLDGGKILVGLLPKRDAIDVDRFLTRYGTIILILMIFPSFGGVSPISAFMSPIIRFLLNLFIPALPSA